MRLIDTVIVVSDCESKDNLVPEVCGSRPSVEGYGAVKPTYMGQISEVRLSVASVIHNLQVQYSKKV